jgi:hypothetical protein
MGERESGADYREAANEGIIYDTERDE